jgi:hypothetical protein
MREPDRWVGQDRWGTAAGSIFPTELIADFRIKPGGGPQRLRLAL